MGLGGAGGSKTLARGFAMAPHRLHILVDSLKSEVMGKLINRIPGSHLLKSSLPGLALRTLVESLGKPRDVNKRSQSLAW